MEENEDVRPINQRSLECSNAAHGDDIPNSTLFDLVRQRNWTRFSRYCARRLKVTVRGTTRNADLEPKHGGMLHLALENLAPVKVVQAIVEIFPDTPNTARDGQLEDLPIHVALRRNASPDTLRVLLKRNISTILWKNKAGDTPFQILWESRPIRYAVDALFCQKLWILIEAEAKAVGQSPLHVAISKTDAGLCQPFVEMAVEKYPEQARVGDSIGRLPLHLVVEKPSMFMKEDPDNQLSMHPLITKLIGLHPKASQVVDPGAQGRLPLHTVVTSGYRWYDGVSDIVNAFNPALVVPDPVTGLVAFQLAALPTGELVGSDVETVYHLLRRSPGVIAKYVTGSVTKDSPGDKARHVARHKGKTFGICTQRRRTKPKSKSWSDRMPTMLTGTSSDEMFAKRTPGLEQLCMKPEEGVQQYMKQAAKLEPPCSTSKMEVKEVARVTVKHVEDREKSWNDHLRFELAVVREIYERKLAELEKANNELNISIRSIQADHKQEVENLKTRAEQDMQMVETARRDELTRMKDEYEERLAYYEYLADKLEEKNDENMQRIVVLERGAKVECEQLRESMRLAVESTATEYEAKLEVERERCGQLQHELASLESAMAAKATETMQMMETRVRCEVEAVQCTFSQKMDNLRADYEQKLALETDKTKKLKEEMKALNAKLEEKRDSSALEDLRVSLKREMSKLKENFQAALDDSVTQRERADRLQGNLDNVRLQLKNDEATIDWLRGKVLEQADMVVSMEGQVKWWEAEYGNEKASREEKKELSDTVEFPPSLPPQTTQPNIFPTSLKVRKHFRRDPEGMEARLLSKNRDTIVRDHCGADVL